MTVRPRRIVILGSTGSIGRNALKVVEAFPGRFFVVGLAAGSDHRLLAAQAARFAPAFLAMSDAGAARRLRESLPGRRPVILEGEAGVADLAAMEGIDLVVSAIAGSAGLVPTHRAVKAGRRVALANKEPLVMAGRLIMAAARRSGAVILPVDSEHHAAAAALRGLDPRAVAGITLTASGGPFLRTPSRELARVTVEQALRHPRWKMGRKITIDSATLMNKGLEIIEARWLFDMAEDRIGVAVHPESVVHAMVRMVDGGLLAYLSRPDMRLPLAAAMNHPEVLDQGLEALDPAALGSLTFEAPDHRRFPGINLARAAIRAGGTAPAALNAANEAAVAAFIEGRVSFTGIGRVVARVLDGHRPDDDRDLETILACHRRATDEARAVINRGRLARKP